MPDISQMSPEEVERLYYMLQIERAKQQRAGGSPTAGTGQPMPPDTPQGGRLPPGTKLPPGADSPLSGISPPGQGTASPGPSPAPPPPANKPQQPAAPPPASQAQPPAAAAPQARQPERLPEAAGGGELPAQAPAASMIDALADRGLVDDMGNLEMKVSGKQLSKMGLTTDEKRFYNRLRAAESTRIREERAGKKKSRSKSRAAKRVKKTLGDLAGTLEDI